MRILIVACASLLLLSWLGGCGGGNCKSMCEEAQKGNCTTIKGDCGEFCDAAESVASKSGCDDKWDEYMSCVDKGDVCDADCDSEESSYGTCAGLYCFAHASDKNCTTLLGSL